MIQLSWSDRAPRPPCPWPRYACTRTRACWDRVRGSHDSSQANSKSQKDQPSKPSSMKPIWSPIRVLPAAQESSHMQQYCTLFRHNVLVLFSRKYKNVDRILHVGCNEHKGNGLQRTSLKPAGTYKMRKKVESDPNRHNQWMVCVPSSAAKLGRELLEKVPIHVLYIPKDRHNSTEGSSQVSLRLSEWKRQARSRKSCDTVKRCCYWKHHHSATHATHIQCAHNQGMAFFF